MGLVVDRTAADQSSQDPRDVDTQDLQTELYLSLRRCADLGAEYFSAYSSARGNEESTGEDQGVSEEQRRLDESVKRSLELWTELMQSATKSKPVEGEPTENDDQEIV